MGSRDAAGRVDQFGRDSLYPVGFVLEREPTDARQYRLTAGEIKEGQERKFRRCRLKALTRSICAPIFNGDTDTPVMSNAFVRIMRM